MKKTILSHIELTQEEMEEVLRNQGIISDDASFITIDVQTDHGEPCFIIRTSEKQEDCAVDKPQRHIVGVYNRFHRDEGD